MSNHRKSISRIFPSYHPSAGQPTYFVEKICNAIYGGLDIYIEYRKKFNPDSDISDLSRKQIEMGMDIFQPKLHTIRAGKKVKHGDTLTLYVWSGKPYRSPQIVFIEKLPVYQTHDFSIDADGSYFINGKQTSIETFKKLALNDGFDSLDDLECWFNISKGQTFDGQIICWSKVDY